MVKGRDKTGGKAHTHRPRGRSRLRVQDTRGIRTRLLSLMGLFNFATQAEFASEAGVPVSTLKGWMLARDAKAPDLANLLSVGRRLGISLDWLTVDPMLPEFRDADRPRKELGDAVREYAVSALKPQFRQFPGLVGDTVPSGDEMLSAAVEWAAKRVGAAAETRRRTARSARFVVGALERIESVRARLVDEGRADLAAKLDTGVIAREFAAAEAVIDAAMEDELREAARQ